MGLITQNGKPIYVDERSVHRLSHDQAIAFIFFMEAEQQRHISDIEMIESTIHIVKQAHSIAKNKEGYYYHEVVTRKMFFGDESGEDMCDEGADHDD